MERKPLPLAQAILACLFAAFTGIGAYIAVPLPISPVPIVLQNMFIILGALVLGPWWSLASVAIYLALGAMGLPVFSGGSGGIAKFAGPTGGYLVGYLAGAVVAGFASRLAARRGTAPVLSGFLAGVAGMTVVYVFGLLRLKAVLGADWSRALAAGLIPFIPGDILKIALAAFLAPRLRKSVADLSAGLGADA